NGSRPKTVHLPCWGLLQFITARQTQSLPVLPQSRRLIFGIANRMLHGEIHMIDIVPDRFLPRRCYHPMKIVERSAQAPHDLQRGSAIKADLVKSQRQKVFPSWSRKNQTQDTALVLNLPYLKMARADPSQQIFNLV